MAQPLATAVWASTSLRATAKSALDGLLCLAVAAAAVRATAPRASLPTRSSCTRWTTCASRRRRRSDNTPWGAGSEGDGRGRRLGAARARLRRLLAKRVGLHAVTRDARRRFPEPCLYVQLLLGDAAADDAVGVFLVPPDAALEALFDALSRTAELNPDSERRVRRVGRRHATNKTLVRSPEPDAGSTKPCDEVAGVLGRGRSGACTSRLRARRGAA